MAEGGKPVSAARALDQEALKWAKSLNAKVIGKSLYCQNSQHASCRYRRCTCVCHDELQVALNDPNLAKAQVRAREGIVSAGSLGAF